MPNNGINAQPPAYNEINKENRKIAKKIFPKEVADAAEKFKQARKDAAWEKSNGVPKDAQQNYEQIQDIAKAELRAVITDAKTIDEQDKASRKKEEASIAKENIKQATPKPPEKKEEGKIEGSGKGGTVTAEDALKGLGL